MRYFLEIAYSGLNYSGWQRQPGSTTVQGVIEEGLSTIFQEDISVIGCGRTDKGVHASQFFLHFDTEQEIPHYFLTRINQLLPKDIAVYRLLPVSDNAHTRFDATDRTYLYRIHFRKDPFLKDTSFFYPWMPLDLAKMNDATSLLLNYTEFYPFAKGGTNVKTNICYLTKAEWKHFEDQKQLYFEISANRFLRGMVRLIVGCMFLIGKGKLEVEQLREAMDEQTSLPRSLSAPPQGLFLTSVSYPYID